MSKEEQTDMFKFLSPFSASVQDIVRWLCKFVWDLHPQANELIFDNNDSIIFYWSPTEKVKHSFCSVTIGKTSNNIRFGFYKGDELADPEKMLTGDHPYRYIAVQSIKDFPQVYITQLLQEAWFNSLKRVTDYKQIIQGKTITKSVSPGSRDKGTINKWINPNLGNILFLSLSTIPLQLPSTAVLFV